MFYSIRHLTKFRYSSPISESVMEVRMQPRSEGSQRCLSFQLNVTPKCRVQAHRDYLGNVVHAFDVPTAHRQLTIIAEGMVDVAAHDPLPAAIGLDAWEALADEVARGDYWEYLSPSHFAKSTAAIEQYAAELRMPSRDESRERDPLQLLSEINGVVHRSIEYVPKSTRVDSPVDDALQNRCGVCQDYTHIMIWLVRRAGIPCRYVSGYLFHKEGTRTRGTASATHAWVEAYLPGPGWLGLDPTNDTLADERHVRTAVGRDYADVPPTRGVFKGDAQTELTVAVRVLPSDRPPPPEAELEAEDWSEVLGPDRTEPDPAEGQQQQ